MRVLLGESGKADTNPPAIGFAALLPLAYRRQLQQLGAELDAAGVVAIVEAHAVDRRKRHLVGAPPVPPPHVVGLASHAAGNLGDEPRDRKACTGTANPAIGAERRLV